MYDSKSLGFNILYVLKALSYIKMDYENMAVAELKALAREHGLRGYSRLRKAELIALLHPVPPTKPADSGGPLRGGLCEQRPPRPSRDPLPSPLVRFRPERLRQQQLAERQQSPQEMNIFEQQEMSKNRPQVTSKLNDWYDWLVNHVPKTIKEGESRAFKTFQDRIMGLYNRVTGNQAQLKGSQSHMTGTASAEPEPFNPIEHEFGGAYKSYRINGGPKMDVDTFFSRIREGLIELIKQELNDLNSARIQTTTWIRFAKDEDRVELAFNSRMMSVHRGSD